MFNANTYVSGIIVKLIYIASQGVDTFIVSDTEEAKANTEKYPKPLNVIEGPLMKVCLYVVCMFTCYICRVMKQTFKHSFYMLW